MEGDMPITCSRQKTLLSVPLDNQSATNLFGNQSLLTIIRKVSDGMTVTTNGGELTTNVKGCLSGYGDAWHCLDATTNMLS